MQKESRTTPWIWEGVVAEEAVTLLSAPEKVGKTTLLSLLLDRRRAGGQLLGRTVYPGKTVVCSEENEHPLARRRPARGHALTHPGTRLRSGSLRAERHGDEDGRVSVWGGEPEETD